MLLGEFLWLQEKRKKEGRKKKIYDRRIEMVVNPLEFERVLSRGLELNQSNGMVSWII